MSKANCMAGKRASSAIVRSCYAEDVRTCYQTPSSFDALVASHPLRPGGQHTSPLCRLVGALDRAHEDNAEGAGRDALVHWTADHRSTLETNSALGRGRAPLTLTTHYCTEEVVKELLWRSTRVEGMDLSVSGEAGEERVELLRDGEG